jgi:hypothetical protein
MATDADDLSGERPLRGRQLNQGGIEDDFKFACHVACNRDWVRGANLARIGGASRGGN